MQNSCILLGILVTAHILVALEGILGVPHFILVSKRVSFDSGRESGSTLGHATLRRPLGNVLEL